MNLAIQMTLFFSLSLLFLTIEKNQRTLMQQKSSRLIQSVCLITSITLASLLSLYLYLWLPELPPVFNVVIADVFLLSLVSFAISLFFAWILAHTNWLNRTLAQLCIVIPILINLAMSTLEHFFSTDFLYTYSVWLGFFWICGILGAGIQERLRIAPIPTFLRGVPLQLLVLLLLLLSFSFFLGMFFRRLF
ncbi:MAG: hypothetical protein ACK5MW_09975 [Enterococcus sp.]